MITLEELKPKRAADFVISSEADGKGEVYLERWYLQPRSKVKQNVYLHHMRRGDMDRHLHDHPWDNVSVVLSGGYWEEVFLDEKQQALCGETKLVWTPPGSIVRRPAERAHKLHLLAEDRDCWSLFFTGPIARVWGFHTEKEWIPFNQYLKRYRPDQYDSYQHQTFEEDA